MKKTGTRRSARVGLRLLMVLGAVVGLLTVGFVSAASAATTIGKAQSESGGNCTFGVEGSVVQETSSGPSYTVPAAGTLTDWSVQEGFYAATVSLEVWHPDGGDFFSLVFRSPSVDILAGNAVVTTALSPAQSVNAGDVLGLHFTGDAPCYVYTGNPADTWGGFFGSTPLNTSTQIFDFTQFLNAQVDVAATFVPTAPVRRVGGTSQSVNPNKTISATITEPGVSAGDTLVVSVATGTFTTTQPSCTDSTGSNTYTVRADKNTGNGRLFVCTSTLAAGLVQNVDSVTASYPSFSGTSVISVVDISASATSGWDAGPGVSTNSGSNPPVNSGNITAGAGQLLVGVVANGNVSSFTSTGAWIQLPPDAGGSGAGKRTLSPVYQFAAGGPTAVTGNLSGSGFWQAAVLAFLP